MGNDKLFERKSETSEGKVSCYRAQKRRYSFDAKTIPTNTRWVTLTQFMDKAYRDIISTVPSELCGRFTKWQRNEYSLMLRHVISTQYEHTYLLFVLRVRCEHMVPRRKNIDNFISIFGRDVLWEIRNLYFIILIWISIAIVLTRL